MTEHQIMLLPKKDYYQWVAAAKDYVIKYRINVTGDPESAGRYMNPDQTVTIANAPGSYGRDIVAWFERNYPGVRLDVVDANTPDDFRNVLAGRVSNDDRYGQTTRPFLLRWPTDYPVITQAFGKNREIYKKFNLPGHEGLDIRAPHRTNIYACADGTVYRTHHINQGWHAYGTHLRLRHRLGYRTIYAHCDELLVKEGDQVRAGDLIALANSTGNSSGSHLHLTLKLDGATDAGLTHYPFDIIDPTPFMQFPSDIEPPKPKFDWPHGKCLVGLHGRGDGPMQEADFQLVRNARIEAVKLLTTARPEDIDRLRAIKADIFILLRMHAAFNDRVVSSEDFARWMVDSLRPFYERGVRYYELHNEPNLSIEGWNYSWRDGKQFGDWFLDVVRRLRGPFPEAKFGYPGLSPGGTVPNVRNDSADFLAKSERAVQVADWIGCHCYWQNEAEQQSRTHGRGYEVYRQHYPDKLLFITEFSNPTENTPLDAKARQYVAYYDQLRNTPGIGAAFSFIASASAYFPHEAWRTEDGRMTEIPAIVAQRAF